MTMLFIRAFITGFCAYFLGEMFGDWVGWVVIVILPALFLWSDIADERTLNDTD